MLSMDYLDWPYEVSVETFAKCNAACTFCPYPTLERQGVRMSDAMIDGIIEELKAHPFPFYFAPFKVNEPFLDKRLIPICQKVNAELPKAHLRLFTNGSALTDRHIAEVDKLERVEHLWISLNECDPVLYRETMALDFDRTQARLDALHQAVAEGRFRWPVVVSRVRQAYFANDADLAFKTFVEERWPLFTPFLIKRDGWIGYTEPNDALVPDRGCARWFDLSITATGVVSLCCMDGEGKYAIGDLNKSGLLEVYNAPHWRQRREMMQSRLDVSPCNLCTY
jgi:hypothetical protein